MADEEEVKEPTDVEALAKEMGWNPDFKGMDREKVDARTFILRSREIQDTMRKQIKTQGGKIEELGDQLSTGFKQFQEFQGSVHKAKVAELNSEIKSLKKDRREAVKENDADLVDDLDEQIDGLKVAANEPAPKAPAQPPRPPHPDFVDWKEENEWYDTDPEMREYADTLYQQNPGLSLKRLLSHIDTKVQEFFPEKVKTKQKEETVIEKKPKVAVAEGGEKKSKAKSKFTRADLTADQLKVADEYVKLGVNTTPPYTIEKYIDDLVATGALS